MVNKKTLNADKIEKIQQHEKKKYDDLTQKLIVQYDCNLAKFKEKKTLTHKLPSLTSQAAFNESLTKIDTLHCQLATAQKEIQNLHDKKSESSKELCNEKMKLRQKFEDSRKKS